MPRVPKRPALAPDDHLTPPSAPTGDVALAVEASLPDQGNAFTLDKDGGCTIRLAISPQEAGACANAIASLTDATFWLALILKPKKARRT